LTAGSPSRSTDPFGFPICWAALTWTRDSTGTTLPIRTPTRPCSRWIGAIFDAVDPMPEMLPELVLFGLDAHDLEAEFARLVESELAVAGAVGTRSVEHARRVTFASDNLTVMVVVYPQRDGKVRLDGWAAPGGRLHAELRVGETILTAECDESGRFVFDAVPAGPAQLVLHPTLDSDPSLTLPVVTPAVHL